MPTIYFLDVTNRDGVQTARISLSKLQKTMLNLYLNEMGVCWSEAGFPFVGHEQRYLNANIALMERGVLRPIVIAGWCRAVAEDVRQTLERTRVRHVNLSLSTSDIMTRGKFQGRKTREDLIPQMTEAVERARAGGAKVVGVNAEDASRTEDAFLIRFAGAARAAGAARFRYCDTLGVDDPHTIYDRIHRLASEVGIPIEVHCHNDLGMAVANSVAGAMAAVDAGVDAYINTTVNGYGERAGNCDLLSAILAVKHSAGYGKRAAACIDPRIDTRAAWKIGRYAAYAFGLPVPINQVGIGDNAFAHESGIHADGVLKDRHNYELYDFESLGRGEPERLETGRIITTGEYGGLKGFRYVYERLGYVFTDDREAARILELVQYAAGQNQKPLTDDELLFLARHPEEARQILTQTPLTDAA
jgi:homocitrate synthase NifV